MMIMNHSYYLHKLCCYYIDQFVKKCKEVLSDNNKHNCIKSNTIPKIHEVLEPTTLTEDLIKKTLEKNNVNLPFKSSKLKLWYK